MGHRNREIEIKLLVSDVGDKKGRALYKEVRDEIRSLLAPKIQSEIQATLADVYWSPPNPLRADFARLRQHSNGAGEITIKQTDRKHNLNRVEIDCRVEKYKQGERILRRLLGEPKGEIAKEYTVFFLGGPAKKKKKHHDQENVSVYQVIQNNKRLEVYIEIEGHTEKFVNQITKMIKRKFSIPTVRMRESLFTLYLG